MHFLLQQFRHSSVEEVEEEEELFEVGETGGVAFEHSCDILRELLLIASVP